MNIQQYQQSPTPSNKKSFHSLKILITYFFSFCFVAFMLKNTNLVGDLILFTTQTQIAASKGVNIYNEWERQ